MVTGKIVKPQPVRTPTGKVKILSQPSGATIWIDGRKAGRTPLTTTLSYGEHKLEAYKKGYRRVIYTLRVRKEETTINVKLVRERKEKPSASIDIITDPPGAEVTIDGKKAGKTPLSGLELEEGEHTMILKLGNYRTVKKVFRLKAGETRTFMENLEPEAPKTTTQGKRPLWKKIIGWTGLALGAVCIGAGTWQLLEARGHVKRAEDAYEMYLNAFTPQEISTWWNEVMYERDRARTASITGYSLLGAGVAFTGTGLYGLLSPVSPSKRVEIKAGMFQKGFIITVGFRP